MRDRPDQGVTQRYGDAPQPSEQEVTVLTAPRLDGATAELQRYERVERYLVLGTLGEGGMGAVYGAYDPLLRRRVALKVIRGDRSVGGEPDARLVREARAMARLSHPNVLPVYDVGHAEGGVFIAMELCEGQTLRGWLDSPRPWAEVLDAFVRAGRGLAAAHAEGLVHRDFKPDNVMIDGRGRVRVLDFGLVAPWSAMASSRSEELGVPEDERLDEATRLTRDGRALGTPLYMAPEQHAGREVDGRADQFAFCVALYTALYGQRPFAGQTVADLVEDKRRGAPKPPGTRVPRGLWRVLRRGLMRSPDDRWPTMHALLDALGGVAAARRRWWMLGGAVVVGGVLAGALAWPRPDPCRPEPLVLPAAASPSLVAHAEAWRQHSRAACETEVEPALASRVQACLQEVRVELLAAARAGAAVELRPASACDPAAGPLVWAADPPADRAAGLELRAALVEARAGGVSPAALEPLVERARRSGDGRVLAEAQLARAAEMTEGGIEAGFEATATATEANDVEAVARGWLTALEAMAEQPARRDEVLGWQAVAEAVVERAGEPAGLLARLALVYAEPLRAAGQHEAARAMLERARRHPGASMLAAGLRRRLDAALR